MKTPTWARVRKNLDPVRQISRAVRKGLERRRFRSMAPSEVFIEIYETNRWRDADSVSGTGSNHAATEAVAGVLAALVRELDVDTLLDVPCGDFHWMRDVDLGRASYIGGDVVPDLVAENRARHAAPGRDFRVIDLLDGPLPAADLLLCRDCLGHLSFADAERALATIAAADVTHVLTTTFPNHRNRDVPTGKWRPLNLQAPPFSLPAPERLFNEETPEGDGRWADKSLGLWPVATLRKAVAA